MMLYMLTYLLAVWAIVATVCWYIERQQRRKWQSFGERASAHLSDVNDHLEESGTLHSDMQDYLERVDEHLDNVERHLIYEERD